VCYLTLKERQAFVENEFVALDVCTTNEGDSNMSDEVCEGKAEEVESGFHMDNK
jgi:hypothetical protein